jgi:putative ABC transport system permease protein
MIWIALKMLTGDRSKYFGIVFGVAFASLLIAHQVSIFIGIMSRTTYLLQNVREGEVWVMDPNVRYTDEVIGLSENDLSRVRGVDGVAWAVKFYRGSVRARLAEGNSPQAKGDFRGAILLGVDDSTLTGVPRKMLMGSYEDLKKTNAVIIDEAGYNYLWPNQPLRIGQELELTDHRAKLVGICDAGQPFVSQPIFFTRYSEAMAMSPPERRLLSFIIVEPKSGITPEALAKRIHEATGLQAVTREQFKWKTIGFYLAYTGIPFNFGITILLGFVVGIAIAGQTFYLFTLENLKQFGALKAMGTSNFRIVGMVLVQAAVVGIIGYGIGMGLVAVFFEATQNQIHLKGFTMIWQVMAGTAVAVIFIVLMASLLSIRKVLLLEPAVVFR